MATKHDNKKVVVILVPYLAHSHLNMFYHLSHFMSAHGIDVHYVSSIQHIKQVKVRNADDIDDYGVIFHEFFVPSCDELVDLHRTLPHLNKPVCELVGKLSSEYDRVVIVHDTLMGSVVEGGLRSVDNVEAYAFSTVSIFNAFVNIWRVIPEKPFELDPPNALPSYLPPRSEGCLPSDFSDFITKEWALNATIDSGALYNGSRAVEGTYIELLEKLHPMKKHFAVGPTISQKIVLNADQNAFPATQSHKCLKWLDNHEKDSVIFISFGTTISLPEKQIRELATGLEKSKQKFMWVLRQADKGDIRDENNTNTNNLEDEVKKILPDGFFERVGNNGMVVTREWVPQLEILGHPSVGGFMSHCGWGSLTESMAMGVPVIACPLHSDQPLNSVLVTQVLKVGVLIRDDYWETRGQLITSDILESVVKRLMASDEGEAMRRRAKDIGRALKESLAQTGASHLDMDRFIAHISRP